MSRVPLWLWPNLLSLDAPLVAVVWQDFIARAYALPLRTPARLVLALTVWAIYLGDRLLDVRRPAVAMEAPRHQFYRRHRAGAMVLLALVLAADLGVTAVAVRPAIVYAGLFALAAVLAYLVLFAWMGVRAVPKEAAVAVLFAAGTFVAAWTRAANPWGLLGGPAAAFAALCFANLVAIENQEWSELREGGVGAPHPITRWAERYYNVWLSVLVAICVVFVRQPWFAAVVVSAVGMLVVVALGRRFRLEVRHVLLDLMLLSPLLFR